MFLEVLGISLIVLGLILVLVNMFLVKFNNNFPKAKREVWKNICVLIPARDESKVIEDLLVSLKEQTINIKMKDVYVIVENENDLSIEIAKKYQASYFVRKELNLKSKGYALDEMIKHLVKENIYYDAYFIMDADNVLTPSFIEEMQSSYTNGYDIAIGFRNLKNGNDSVVAAASGITFSFLNSNGNELKNRQSRNITLSGTGLFIVGDLIKKWQGFPFHSLTEDYELTLYSIENNLTSFYNKEAMFFDEQAIKYKSTVNQRMRWVRGYFDNRKKYLPRFRKKLKNNANFGSLINELLGMKPYILMIIGCVLYILNQIINVFKFKKLIMVKISLFKISIIIGLAYVLFALMTAFVIYKDKEKLALNKKMIIKTIFFSPLFFVTYVPCALKAIFKKTVNWEKVDHTRRWKN